MNTVPPSKLTNTKAWKLTSLYVRKKADGICYTCERKIEFKRLSAGHFREKRGNAGIFFDLRGLRAQCYYCNRRLHGAKDIYAMKLEKEDPGVVEYLYKKSIKPKTWTKEELKEIANAREKDLISLSTEGY